MIKYWHWQTHTHGVNHFVQLPCVDRWIPLHPADSHILSELLIINLATGYVEVCLLPEGRAKRFHGLWRDLHHQPIW